MKKTVRAYTLLLTVLLLLSIAMPAAAADGAAYLESSEEASFKLGDSVSLLAAELTEGKSTTEEKAMAIYNHIVTNYSYDWELYNLVVTREITRYTPDPNAVLKKKKGICYDIVSLYAAMCRSIGIPAKIVKGYTKTVQGYHTWNSVYDQERGKWISVDLTVDMCLGKGASSSWRPMKKGAVIKKEV